MPLVFCVLSNKLFSSNSNYYRKLVIFIYLGLANNYYNSKRKEYQHTRHGHVFIVRFLKAVTMYFHNFVSCFSLQKNIQLLRLIRIIWSKYFKIILLMDVRPGLLSEKINCNSNTVSFLQKQ